MASITVPQFQLTSTQTALAFILPEHLQAEVNSLRKIHDKAFTKWQPHINVLYPFVEPSRLASAITILRQKLENAERIKLNANDVGVFRHQRNATIFLKSSLDSEESICLLRRVLVQALGCDEKNGTHDGTFRPHLTVGQASLLGPSVEKLTAQVEKLSRLNWEGRSLVVLEREMFGRMKAVEELSLGTPNAEFQISDNIAAPNNDWRESYFFARNIGWGQTSDTSKTSGQLNSAQVQVTTYNLMADSSAPSFKSRLPLIIEAISSTKSSTSALRVLCLQEINEEMLPLLLSDPFITSNLPFSTHMPSSLLPSHRNLITLASQPFKYHSLSLSERHKTALIASFFESALQVANIHLSSALTDKALEAKLGQMRLLTELLNQGRETGKRYIVAGDFNLTTSTRTMETALSRNIVLSNSIKLIAKVIDPDIWDDTFNLHEPTSTHCQEVDFEGEEGATFDRLTNPLAAMTNSPIENRPERYDRILLEKGQRGGVNNFEIIGQPNGHGICGSDHYGVSVLIQMGEVINEEDISHLGKKFVIIEVVKDTTALHPLLQPFLPTQEDQKQRRDAIALLRETLRSGDNTSDLILATLGSYLMNTYFPESDVDVLAIGSISPEAFFDLATKNLRALSADEFKGVHFVNSLVRVVEVSVLGIKFDLQYCQAPELLKRYNSAANPDLRTLVFDNSLISTLSPSSIRPLNTFRDTAYLLNTLPDLTSYQAAHRYLSLYLKRRGLYSAKFGYLGGIHLSLMLNRIVKLIEANDGADVAVNISAATIIRTFFPYYSTLNWAEDDITDPSLPSHRSSSRSSRDSIFINSIHTPTARRNVASSCTYLTTKTLTKEFSLATEKLQLGDWKWCIRTPEYGISDFFDGFGAFICVQIDIWDADEIGGDKIREMIGGLESKFPRLLVSLGRISGLDGQVWPARFQSSDKNGKARQGDDTRVERELKGCYLVGIAARDTKMDGQEKKLFTGKVITAIREFETTTKESRELQNGNVWISMELIPRKKIMDMGLVLDARDWGRTEGPLFSEPTARAQMIDVVDNVTTTSSSAANVPRKYHKTSLRLAQDIISRIH